ncbi:DUF6306 domain-containing protein [Ammoniphilus sp. 3BR4]
MKEQVGSCIRCKKDVYCTDGFFNGIILENGNILCFECKENDQLIEILNRLLEAEKSGVVTLDYLLKAFPSAGLEASFQQVREDEAWSCSGLIHAIQREGGVLGKQVGDFADKVKSLPTLREKLELLNKGQAWVARKIDDALSYGMDAKTKDFLLEMKRRHEQNIEHMNTHL